MFDRAMKRGQKRGHEVGNIYLKALAGLPRETWQEWELVKVVERLGDLPHVIMQEVGGKTTRTVAISALNDPTVWAMRDAQAAAVPRSTPPGPRHDASGASHEAGA